MPCTIQKKKGKVCERKREKPIRKKKHLLKSFG